MTTNNFGNWRPLTLNFDDAAARLPDALMQEGFGIITHVDIQETFKAKLGVSFKRYRIFGACNPSFAHEALMMDPRVGVLLPCNVVLYENDEGKTILGAVDPMQTLGAGSAVAAFAKLAQEVGARLERVLASMAS